MNHSKAWECQGAFGRDVAHRGLDVVRDPLLGTTAFTERRERERERERHIYIYTYIYMGDIGITYGHGKEHGNYLVM